MVGLGCIPRRYMPDLVFVHVAVATMELQAGVENVSLQFCGEELG
jgi:hypothetical protein